MNFNAILNSPIDDNDSPRRLPPPPPIPQTTTSTSESSTVDYSSPHIHPPPSPSQSPSPYIHRSTDSLPPLNNFAAGPSSSIPISREISGPVIASSEATTPSGSTSTGADAPRKRKIQPKPSTSTAGGSSVPPLNEGEDGEDGNDDDEEPKDGEEKPKRKRRRQALSCMPCKKRKIRCDRKHPCTPCVKRNDQASCRWSGPEPVENEALLPGVSTITPGHPPSSLPPPPPPPLPSVPSQHLPQPSSSDPPPGIHDRGYVSRAEFEDLRAHVGRLELVVAALTGSPNLPTDPTYLQNVQSSLDAGSVEPSAHVSASTSAPLPTARSRSPFVASSVQALYTPMTSTYPQPVAFANDDPADRPSIHDDSHGMLQYLNDSPPPSSSSDHPSMPRGLGLAAGEPSYDRSSDRTFQDQRMSPPLHEPAPMSLTGVIRESVSPPAPAARTNPPSTSGHHHSGSEQSVTHRSKTHSPPPSDTFFPHPRRLPPPIQPSPPPQHASMYGTEVGSNSPALSTRSMSPSSSFARPHPGSRPAPTSGVPRPGTLTRITAQDLPTLPGAASVKGKERAVPPPDPPAPSLASMIGARWQQNKTRLPTNPSTDTRVHQSQSEARTAFLDGRPSAGSGFAAPDNDAREAGGGRSRRHLRAGEDSDYDAGDKSGSDMDMDEDPAEPAQSGHIQRDSPSSVDEMIDELISSPPRTTRVRDKRA